MTICNPYWHRTDVHEETQPQALQKKITSSPYHGTGRNQPFRVAFVGIVLIFQSAMFV